MYAIRSYYVHLPEPAAGGLRQPLQVLLAPVHGLLPVGELALHLAQAGLAARQGAGGLLALPVEIFELLDAFVKGLLHLRLFPFVITSYSIHYTKLYDDAVIDEPGEGGVAGAVTLASGPVVLMTQPAAHEAVNVFGHVFGGAVAKSYNFV